MPKDTSYSLGDHFTRFIESLAIRLVAPTKQSYDCTQCSDDAAPS